MATKEDFTKIVNADFITARTMIMLVLVIEVIVQTFAILVNPTEWWTWQLLGFITATNLGAVIIAITAQKNAEDIARVYRAVFTEDFYETVHLMTAFRNMIRDEAEKDGREMNDEMKDLSPKLYGLARKCIDVKAAQHGVIPPDPLINVHESWSGNPDDLFIETDNEAGKPNH